MRKYIVDEDRLITLLAAEMKLVELEGDGVDNWSWYGEGRQECMEEFAAGRLSEEELEDADYHDIAKLDLANYEECREEIK